MRTSNHHHGTAAGPLPQGEASADALLRRMGEQVRGVALVVADAHGGVVVWGAGARETFGHEAEEALGRHLGMLFPGGEAAAEEAMRQAREGGGERDTEESMRRASGSLFPASILVTALGGAASPSGYAVLVRDLARRREPGGGEVAAAYREAQAARAEAERASRAKSQFLANMSHEIRTPINAIIGYTDLLEMGIGGPLTEGQRTHLERVKRSSQHLLGLVDDILDLSKVEAGEMQVRRELLPLGATVRDALGMVAPQASARGVAVRAETHCAPEARFRGDEDRVRQVLLNLLSNAVKFTGRGGRVTVRCRVVDRPVQEAALSGGGPWAAVEVEDTGVGIEPERLGEIFAPFVQVDAAHTRREGGTGLGLTISRKLARLMGGDLTVRSSLGEGSCFVLWLPAGEEEAAATAEAGDGGGWPSRPGQIAGLAEAGRVLSREAEPLVSRLGERMRADPRLPGARGLDRAQLENHIATFLLDIGKSLVTLDEGGGEPELMHDGSRIQRFISERHGDQRCRLGWSVDELKREFELLREEVERMLVREVRLDSGQKLEAALGIVRRLLERAEWISERSWLPPGER